MIAHTESPNAYRVKALQYTEPLFSSLDIDGWNLNYTQLSTGKYESDATEVGFSGVQICTASWNSTLHQSGIAQPNSYIFGIPYEMLGEGRINGQRWCGTTCAAFRGEEEFDTYAPPMKLLIVSISRDLFADYLSTVEHVSAEKFLKNGLLIMNDSARLSFAYDSFTSFVESCRKDPNIIGCRQVRDGITQSALEILTPLILDNLDLTLSPFTGLSRTQVVRRAREFALSNIDEPLQIIDLCRELGVSRRALQYSFQDVLNVNPVAYLRLLRLNGARRDLINAAEKPVQVQDVVARWGFWHFSRFSAEYKKMFNELPSETLRRASQHAGQGQLAAQA